MTNPAAPDHPGSHAARTHDQDLDQGLDPATVAAGAARDDVLAGLSAIRQTAEAFMDKRDLADDGWTEPEVTSVSVTEGRPHVQVVMFNQNQEGRGLNALGADYLWWWLDSMSGECFGMLVQAKRLTLDGDQWRVDISHRSGDQLRTLLRTARELQVPAVYSIYTGGLVYRAALPCLHRDDHEGLARAAPAPPGTTPGTGLDGGHECERCRRMAISMVTAYQLSSGWESAAMTGNTALTESVPLEDLADPAVPADPIWDVNLRELTNSDLVAFLQRPQDGAREIARRIFRLVAVGRAGAFSAATAEPITVPGAPVFDGVPGDSGHFPGPYYAHVLRGLRTSPPAYVAELVDELRHPSLPDWIWDLPDPSDGTIGRMIASGPSPGRRRPAELDSTDVAGVVLVTL